MAVGFEASDLFALGANFHEQSSNSITVETNAFMLDKSRNQECITTGLNTMTNYDNEFAYCNATPDIKTDLGTHATQFGDVFDSKKMTQLVINYTAGEYATVTVNGHQHAENAHAAGFAEGFADVSGAIPASSGFGVPTWTGQTTGADCEFNSATLTFSGNHVDVVGADGNHFTGKTITIRAELTIEATGTPTTPLPTGWNIVSQGPGDSSTAHDTWTGTWELWYDIATS